MSIESPQFETPPHEDEMMRKLRERKALAEETSKKIEEQKKVRASMRTTMLPQESQVERTESTDRFAQAYREVLLAQKSEGVPIDEYGRIDASIFKGTVYDDSQYIAYQLQLEAKNQRDATRNSDPRKVDFRAAYQKPKDNEAEHEKLNGALLERWATLAFNLNKVFNEYFLFTRTAPYDDKKGGRGGDNLIIDRATGETIGLADETVDEINGTVFTSHRRKIDKNHKTGGGAVKFGVRIDENKKIVPIGAVGNLPIILINLPQEKIEELKKIGNLKDIESLYNKFFSQMEAQVQALKNRISTLDQSLADKVTLLASRLEEIKSKV